MYYVIHKDEVLYITPVYEQARTAANIASRERLHGTIIVARAESKFVSYVTVTQEEVR
jgi:hypothetical protein